MFYPHGSIKATYDLWMERKWCCFAQGNSDPAMVWNEGGERAHTENLCVSEASLEMCSRRTSFSKRSVYTSSKYEEMWCCVSPSCAMWGEVRSVSYYLELLPLFASCCAEARSCLSGPVRRAYKKGQGSSRMSTLFAFHAHNCILVAATGTDPKTNENEFRDPPSKSPKEI